MSAPVAVRPVTANSGLRPAAAVLGAGALLWLLLFHAEAAAALHVWSTSTAYGHCFLVIPVAAWLAWERRDVLAAGVARPLPDAAWLAPPLAVAWFAAERLGVMEGRQLVAIAVLELLALAVLGRSLWWAAAVPLLYLIFLVPFGGFLVGPLQFFTARFIDVGLDVLGVPHVVTRFLIEIPEGSFRVAEACAGLRFLIAAIAFGVVYACTIYRSPGRRVAFIAASTVVPVIANGFRALGIVELGHLKGSAEAGAVDHVLYGWIFFSLVILLLILVGLPFREDGFAAPRVRPALPSAADGAGRLRLAAALVLLLAAIGPALAAVLNAIAAPAPLSAGNAAGGLIARLPTPPGCDRAAPDRFDCDGATTILRAEAFAPRATAATLVAARRAATALFDPELSASADLALGRNPPLIWQVTYAAAPAPIVATLLWDAGRSRTSGLSLRLHRAWASVLGGRAPVLVTATQTGQATQTGLDDGGARLRAFLDDESAALVAGLLAMK